MNVLILGSGGREHALAWKISQSKLCDNLFVAPGNPGTAELASNVDLDINDFEAVAECVKESGINMIVVGPEDPLAKGIVNYFREIQEDWKPFVIGPDKIGAQLEASKDFAKAFMARHNIPTAAYKSFTKSSLAEAKSYLGTVTPPYVLKADGLAAGKGVVILNTLQEAEHEITQMLGNSKFGKASEKVVIEEFLDGIELSVFALTDGTDYILLPEAKDYKRIGDGDTGLNTGGMGAVSPVPFADKTFMDKVEKQIVIPTVNGLNLENIRYVGFLFFGIIKVGDEPFVIEYNVRMGDPETEVVMPRIESDFLELLQQAANKKLGAARISINPDFATTVMLVSGGYPESYEKGKAIGNIEGKGIVYHAGTAKGPNGLVTNGGRVMAITGKGKTLTEALEVSYALANAIKFEGKYFRKDIGADLQ